MKKRKKKGAISVKVIFFSCISILILAVFVFYAKNQTPRRDSKAAGVNALYTRVSQSYVLPGGSYTLWAIADKKTNRNYSGYLEVLVTACDSYGQNCKTSQGIWKNFDGTPIYISGAFKVNIPYTQGANTFKARYRPSPNPYNFDWSNEVQVNISTTYGLENMRDYWVFWSGEKTFYGRNKVWGENFTTKIGFEPIVNVCGIPVRPMTFKKDSAYGYWRPASPWYNQLWSWTPNYGKDLTKFNYRFSNDLRWFLVDWQKKPGWQDTWLTVYGYTTYRYKSGMVNSAALSNSITHDSNDPTIPNYFLAPQWLGPGWGNGTNKALMGGAEVPASMCTLTNSSTTNVWSAHADLLTLATSRGSFPALRIKYLEGEQNYMYGANFVREDFWFIKGQGLVRIDTKEFGSYPGFGRSACMNDNDCLLNDIMSNPNTSLTRSDFL